jgi:glycosyltransferase involved in cell wall biosynthesis
MMLICELGTFDGGHAELNAAVIATARAAFPEKQVCFLAANRHSSAVSSELARYRISNVRFEILPDQPKGGKVSKHWYIICTVRSVFRLFRKLGCSQLLVCGLHQELHNYLLILMPKWFRGPCCGLVHHGNYLVLRTHATRLDWLKNGVVHFLTKKKLRKLRVVVLASTVARFLTENLTYAEVEIKWIYHPYHFDEETEKRALNKKPINFVFLGRTSKGKGFDIFCRLANEISNVFPAQDVAFTLVGGLRKIPKEYSKNGPVHVASPAYRLTRDDLSRHLQKASYLVMPYMTAVYGKKKTTGIFLDAIKYLKPIIALKSDDLAHYFEKFGELGFLCESVEEMKQVLLDIIQTPPLKEYSEQQARLLKAREFLHPEHQKDAFKALWQD